MKRFGVLLLVLLAVGTLGAGQLFTGNSLDERPECSDTYRGRTFATYGAASANDQMGACARNAAGADAWYAVPLVTATVTPINLAVLPNTSCSATSIAWTGVTDGEVLSVGVDSAQSLTLQANATATDTVVIYACNPTALYVDSGSINYRIERRLR
jgi:hypothetical protein